ncbi:RimK/LysX family protein [uncultured Sulfitobacter sp.]|uniref:ATP-dependent zinc protease family protein n=1 Tax=uncultured Sulfitobacter sp. TaxID=191468 RepID=UPI00260F7FA4|nr:RimK/LysX family protein [uncultured Sulfitobacter sp.]
MQKAKSGTSAPPTVIGWHEAISLPDLNLLDFSIKVDTGAKTTALHAEDIEVFWRDGEKWVRFATQATAQNPIQICEQPVLTKRDITNTGGTPERRIVIRTPMVLGGRRWRIDVSLTDRANMRFPLILGRRALRGRNIVVHPAKSYLVSEKPILERRP